MSFARTMCSLCCTALCLGPGKQLCRRAWKNLAARRYTGEMDFKLVPRTLIFTIAGVSLSVSAWAQWQWIDKDGRKVFSDRSPPAEIQEKDILKRPGANSPSSPMSTAGNRVVAAPAAAGKVSVPRLSGKDAQLEARKKQAEEAEADHKKAEDEKIAKARADNCERAKRGLANLESGVRIAVSNARGEREVMDDAARGAETKRLQGIAASDCKL